MSTIRTTVGTLRRVVSRLLEAPRRKSYEFVIITREDPETGEEMEINVTYNISGRYYPATHVDPAEYAEIELQDATLADGTPVELTDYERAEATDLATEHVDQRERDNADLAAEYRYDMMRDR